MGNRVIARCEGCKAEIVLAQEGAETMAHLSAPELETFLRDHERCRSNVATGPHISKRMEASG